MSFMCERGHESERGGERGHFCVRERCYETKKGERWCMSKKKGAERGDARERERARARKKVVLYNCSQWVHREVKGAVESPS